MPTTTVPAKLQPSQDDLYGRIVAAIIAARKDAGLSQTVLAGRLGRPQSFVSKYEHRERTLDVAEFVEIATAIGVDSVELLSDALRN
jgi:transcriptional regulator with XRE-family HTH domain